MLRKIFNIIIKLFVTLFVFSLFACGSSPWNEPQLLNAAKRGDVEDVIYPKHLKMLASELSQRFQYKAHSRRNVVTFQAIVTQ